MLIGTLVNGIAIIIGALIGSSVTNISQKIKTTLMQGMALAVIALGISLSLKSEQFLILFASLVVGGLIGEKIDIENKVNRFGSWLESKIGGKSKGDIAKAFITTSVMFVFGPLSIIGSLDAGLRGDNTILFTKAVMEGFSAIVFSSVLGIGVIFTAIPLVLFQLTIIFVSFQASTLIPTEMMSSFTAEITAVAGILIFAVGLNILDFIKIRVANFIPAIIIVALLVFTHHYWQLL